MQMHEELTITSDNKKVYANMLYGHELILDKLNSESFMQESDFVWDTFSDTIPDSYMMTHIHALNLLVKDSTVILKHKKYEYDGIVHTFYVII